MKSMGAPTHLAYLWESFSSAWSVQSSD